MWTRDAHCAPSAAGIGRINVSVFGTVGARTWARDDGGARALGVSSAARRRWPAVNELKAIKVDNRGNAWRVGVRVGGGHGLPRLHARRPAPRARGASGTPRDAHVQARHAHRAFPALQRGHRRQLRAPHGRARVKAAAGAIASAVSGRGRPARRSSLPWAPLSLSTWTPARTPESPPPDADADDAVDDFPLRALECVLDKATGTTIRRCVASSSSPMLPRTITDELKTRDGARAWPSWFPASSSASTRHDGARERRAGGAPRHLGRYAVGWRVDTLLPRPPAQPTAPIEGTQRDREVRTASARGVGRVRERRLGRRERRRRRCGSAPTHLARARRRRTLEMSRQVEAARGVGAVSRRRAQSHGASQPAGHHRDLATAMAVPAWLAGMNIPNGLAAPPALFWTVTGCSPRARRGGGVSCRGARGAAESRRARGWTISRRSIRPAGMDDLGNDRAQSEPGRGRRPERDNDVDLSPGVGQRGTAPRAGRVAGAPARGRPRLAAQMTARTRALNLLFRVFDRDGDGRIDPARGGSFARGRRTRGRP